MSPVYLTERLLSFHLGGKELPLGAAKPRVNGWPRGAFLPEVGWPACAPTVQTDLRLGPQGRGCPAGRGLPSPSPSSSLCGFGLNGEKLKGRAGKVKANLQGQAWGRKAGQRPRVSGGLTFTWKPPRLPSLRFCRQRPGRAGWCPCYWASVFSSSRQGWRQHLLGLSPSPGIVIYDEGAAAAANSLQSCPTLCHPIDGSPPAPKVPGILQARTLEWVAISFSNAWKWKVKVKSLSVSYSLRPHGLQPTRLLRPKVNIIIKLGTWNFFSCAYKNYVYTTV